MAGHDLADIAEAIGHLAADVIDAARPFAELVARQLAWEALSASVTTLRWSQRLCRLADRLAPPLRAADVEPTDPRVNVVRGGSC